MMEPSASSMKPEGREEGGVPSAHNDLRETVSRLLSTQQELISLRDRRDREQKILESIVRFSERAGTASSDEAFWEHVSDAIIEAFECEACLAVRVKGKNLAILASRGPRPATSEEQQALAALIIRNSASRMPLLVGTALGGLRFQGQEIATLMFDTMPGTAAEQPGIALVTAVSARKKPFFPEVDELSVPGLRMFASHVHALHQILYSRRLIAEQVEALDHTNTELNQRMLEQKKAMEEQDHLRMELMHSQRMESIGRLAGGVAHDFNNLLTVICGNIELMQMDISLPQQHQQALAETLAASMRAQSLTQQLLMFSRKQVIRPSQVDINELIGHALRMYTRLIGEDIRLKFNRCPEPTPAQADRQQFDQLLGNLLLNARDALVAAKGNLMEIRITTSVERKRSPLTGGASAIRMDITDFGQGMDEKTKQQIFEPFFTTKEQGKGTGLGLATVLGVVQQNEGIIEVTSSPGQGSTFSVFWPLHDAGTAAEAMLVEPLPQFGRSETVLLVEDEKDVRNVLVKGLEHEGFLVKAFSGAEPALEFLGGESTRPAILVTDVVMPHINGRQLAEAARQRLPGLPVLFISGYTEDIIADHGVLREGVALLEKPFSPSDLAHKVREILDNQLRHP